MAIFSLTEAELRNRRSLKWATYPADVLPLWVAEMDTPLHPCVRNALEQAMKDGDTGYSAGTGYQEAFSEFALKHWNWDIHPAQIRRAVDVMHNILSVLEVVTDPGDQVVINTPVYPPFRQVVAGSGRLLLESPLVNDRINLVELEKIFAGHRPAVYLLCSPHNPTGTVHTYAELEKVAQLANRYGVQVLVDEIHGPIVDPEHGFTPFLTVPETDNAIVCTSAGKSWNLAAFKAGLIITGRGATQLWDRLRPLTIDSSGHWGVIAHTAALRNCENWINELCVEVSQHKQLLAELLAKHLPEAKYTIHPGTYLGWVDCSAYNLGNAAQHFLDHGKVAFGFGDAYDPLATDWIRVNLATHVDIITEAIERAGRSIG